MAAPALRPWRSWLSRSLRTRGSPPETTHAQAEGPSATSVAAAPGVGLRRLDELEPGERGVILRLDGASALERRLMELGLVPGTAIEVVRRAPLGDPVEVRIRDVSLSLRRTETRRIHVAPR